MGLAERAGGELVDDRRWAYAAGDLRFGWRCPGVSPPHMPKRAAGAIRGRTAPEMSQSVYVLKLKNAFRAAVSAANSASWAGVTFVSGIEAIWSNSSIAAG